MAEGNRLNTKVGMETTDWKTGVAEIKRDSRVLDSQFRVVAAGLDDWKKSAQGLEARHDQLSKKIQNGKKIVEEYSNEYKKIVEKYGAASKEAQEFEIKLNREKAALNANEKSLRENEEGLKDFGKDLDEAGKSAERNTKKFALLKTAFVGIGTAAAAAGVIAFKLGKEVINQFGQLEQSLGGSKAVFGDYADDMQTIGENAYKTMGASQNEYLASANKIGALMQGNGIEQQRSAELTATVLQRAADVSSVMGVASKDAFDAVTGAAKGNYTMMDNLGVAMNDTSLKSFALANGFKGIWAQASQAEKTEYAFKMFLENTSQYAGNFEKEATQTITGSIGMLKAATTSFIGGLGNTNADMTNLTGNLVDAFEAVVKNIIPVLENIVRALPTAFSTILGAIGGLLPMLIETFTGLFTETLQMLLNLLPELIPAAVQAVLTIVRALIDNLPLIVDAAIQLVLAIVEGLGQAYPELIPAAVNAVTIILQSIVDNLPLFLEAAILMISAIAEGLIEALPQFTEALIKIVEAVMDFLPMLITTLIDFIPQMIAAGILLILAIIEDLPQIIRKIVDSLPQIIDAIEDGLMSAIPQIVEAGVVLFVAIIENLPQIILEVIKAIPQIIRALVVGLKAGVSAIAEVGGALMTGLWNGIANKINWIVDKIKGFGTSVLNAIRKIFDTHSPSKETEEIGDNVGVGFGIGIEKSIVKVKAQTAKLHQAVAGELSFKNQQIKISQAIEYAKMDEKGALIDYEKLAEVFWAKEPKKRTVMMVDKKVLGEVTEPEVSKIQASKGKDRKAI